MLCAVASRQTWAICACPKTVETKKKQNLHIEVSKFSIIWKVKLRKPICRSLHLTHTLRIPLSSNAHQTNRRMDGSWTISSQQPWQTIWCPKMTTKITELMLFRALNNYESFLISYFIHRLSIGHIGQIYCWINSLACVLRILSCKTGDFRVLNCLRVLRESQLAGL